MVRFSGHRHRRGPRDRLHQRNTTTQGPPLALLYGRNLAEMATDTPGHSNSGRSVDKHPDVAAMAASVEGHVGAGDKHLDALLREEELRVCDDPRLAVVRAVVPVEPRGDRVPLCVQFPIRLRGVHEVVEQAALDKDLQEVAGTPALALLAAELSDVEAMAFANLDDALGESLHLPFGHQARRQHVLQDADKRDILLMRILRPKHRRPTNITWTSGRKQQQQKKGR